MHAHIFLFLKEKIELSKKRKKKYRNNLLFFPEQKENREKYWENSIY